MPITPLTIHKNTLPTTLGTLFTVPASTTYIVKSIYLVNTSYSIVWVTLRHSGIHLLADYALPEQASTVFESSVVMEAGTTLEGVGSILGVVDIQVLGVSIA